MTLTSNTSDAVCGAPAAGSASCTYNPTPGLSTIISVSVTGPLVFNPSLTIANGGAGTTGWSVGDNAPISIVSIPCASPAGCANANTTGAANVTITMNCATFTDTATLTSNTGDAVCKPASIGTTSCVYTASAATATTITATCTAAAPILGLTPDPMNFGNVTIGTTATQMLTISNIGTAPLTVSGIGFQGTALGFGVAIGTCSGVFPFTLAVGASCAVSVDFSPLVAGAAAGAVLIDSDTGGVPLTTTTVVLSGTGAAVVTNPPAPAPSAGGGGGGGGGGGLENQPPYHPGGGGWLRSPSNGGSGNGDTPFVWYKLTDLDGDTITYYVYVCPNGVFEGCQPIKVVVGNGDDTAPKRLGYGMGALGAGLLLIGFGFTRGGRKTLLVLLAAISLTSSAALIACGASSGSSNGVTVASCSAAGADARCAENLGLAAGAYQWKVTAE
ncbi:MAG: choice-of-anchor D domain-containing protein, partial [Nitrospinota bacterium]|nr:choice-of-anchor D domain-containing protein [Nitrospinota bacterium]